MIKLIPLSLILSYISLIASLSCSLLKPQDDPSDILIASTPSKTASSKAAKISCVSAPSFKSGNTFCNTNCVLTATPVIVSSEPPMIPAT